ncbi:MAG: CehA/McbA family metallohydrolase, partial [Clostridiales bacterium]
MNQVYLNRKKLVIMFLVLLITLITLFNYTTLFGAKSDNYNNTKVKYNPYANAQPNQWLKGCTHCHTTNSDGENSLEEMITGFKENKFDFAFITDHGKVTGDNTLKDGLLVLKGEEMETSIEENNAFFINDTMEDSDENSAVTTIADVKKQGGFCQLNHPMRKDIDKEEILKLAEAGLWGIEMLNSGDDLVPSSTLDYILSKGIHIWSTFGADAHNVDDVNLGWIMVNSSELTVDSIKENMIAGNFYSTTGPLIDDIKVENNLIKIATNSDQSEIKWYSDGDKVVGKGDSYTIKGNEIYVRAVIGDNTKIAMTQPIFIDKENDNTNENINNETKEKSEFGNDSETT